MKKIAIIIFLVVCFQLEAQPIFSENGHPEHFIAGTLISGVTSYLVFKKTDNKIKAWVIGAATGTAVGVLKEIIDPELLSGTRSRTDMLYSGLGSVFGASIVIPLKKRKPNKTPNITKAFNERSDTPIVLDYN